jgi:hypothetical protein
VATDIPVIVPRRADGGRRDQLFEFVRNWYAEQGYTVVEGHHNDGLFSRSAAINGALAELDWEVCVIADGDVILGSGDQVDKAVDLARRTGQMVYAHDMNHQMSEQGTELILNGETPNPAHADQIVANTWSSCQAIRRDSWDRVGGFDERLYGWGWDDLVFMSCCTALLGIGRIKGPMFHLWHHRDPAWQEGNEHYKVNEQLGRRFMDARNDREAIEYLLSERGVEPQFTNVGKWNAWHGKLKEPHPYANTETYRLGAEWLADCDLVEDWGAGAGWLRTFINGNRYRGIDGSQSPFTVETADLALYRSETPGLFMRHVLEHDTRWWQILDNALDSFTERMVLILFTPLSKNGPHDLEWEDPPGVPNLSFALTDITDRFKAAGVNWEMQQVPGPVKYGGPETVFRISR